MVRTHGRAAPVLVGDVREPEVCERIVAEAVAALGGLDGVVLNVGIGAGGGLAGTSGEDWDDVFAVNVRSHFLVGRAALPPLEAGAGQGFLSSLAGPPPRRPAPP